MTADPHPDIGRSVVDRVTGHTGTVVRVTGTRYIVHWDPPTPNQDDVATPIPSRWFDWANRGT